MLVEGGAAVVLDEVLVGVDVLGRVVVVVVVGFAVVVVGFAVEVVVVVDDVVVVAAGPTRIGSLRAISFPSEGTSGSGLDSRNSYDPAARSAGRRSGEVPAAAPVVGHQATMSEELNAVEPSA